MNLGVLRHARAEKVARVLMIAKRITKADESIALNEQTRDLFVNAGCTDLRVIHRSAGIRIARLHMLTYALQMEITGQH